MHKTLGVFIISSLLICSHSAAFAWHDTGHMVVAQIAYLRLAPAAKAKVDQLLVTPPGKRPLIHYCVQPYDLAACERVYDPITIAVWMDDFRGDSLNDAYAPWHYINYKPVFDGIPESGRIGPEPENVLARINWAINTLRKGTGKNKTDAETLGYLYHLVGDVHQPLHAATRYSAAHPDGDAGGNLFLIKMPPETRIKNLHAYWDAAAGLFGFENPRRPLNAAARTRIRELAEQVMKAYPAEADPAWKEIDPHRWVEESNHLARQFAYAKIKEGDAPSEDYTKATQQIARRRIALAGYRLAEVLNKLFEPK